MAFSVPVNVVADRASTSDSVYVGYRVRDFAKRGGDTFDTSSESLDGFERVIGETSPFPVVSGDGSEAFDKVWVTGASDGEWDKGPHVIVPYVGPYSVIPLVGDVVRTDSATAMAVGW